jgi:sugar/nucleoside kinase (ribokinase family)
MMNASPEQDTRIAGIGSALVDILLQEEDAFLDVAGATRGGMVEVDYNKIEAALESTDREPVIAPGGSACNTVVGAARLGCPARFIRTCGDDEFGDLYERDLIKHGVEPLLTRDPSRTGCVLSIITPDAQRSMLTFLGASSRARPEEMIAERLAGASVVHIEGYLLFNHDLIRRCFEAARAAGAAVSLDLASFTVVEANRDVLPDMIEEYVDILIANEDEGRVFTGCTDEKAALSALSRLADIAVLKAGKRGSYISRGAAVTHNGILGSGSAVDTTGAGDLWAAGFLFGLVNKFPMEKCGRIAAACGYEVCQVVGAHIPQQGWERIKLLL